MQLKGNKLAGRHHLFPNETILNVKIPNPENGENPERKNPENPEMPLVSGSIGILS
jgi:hypothetical protein